MSPHGAPANSIHLCTEKNRSGCRLHRSLPSKNHAATPPQNHAVVEAPLRAVRAASSSFSGPMAPIRKRSERRHAFSCGCGISDKNEMARSFVYLCAPLSPPAPLLPPPFLERSIRDARSVPRARTPLHPSACPLRPQLTNAHDPGLFICLQGRDARSVPAPPHSSQPQLTNAHPPNASHGNTL